MTDPWAANRARWAQTHRDGDRERRGPADRVPSDPSPLRRLLQRLFA